MSIQPLKNLADQREGNKIASTRWVQRFVRATLAKFNLTVEGGELEETGEGHLHLRIDAAGSGSHPFRVQRGGNGVTVVPGFVYTIDFTSGNAIVSHIPTIAGLSLDSPTRPSLTIPGNFSGYICLRMVFSAEDGSAVTPWSIVAVTTPSDTQLVRELGAEPGLNSEVDLILAKMVNGAVKVQGVTHSLFATTSWNTIILSAM